MVEMRHLVVIITLVPCLNHCLLQFSVNDTVAKELQKYFVTYKQHISKNYSSCSYINVHLPLTRDISNLLIQENDCPSITVTTSVNYPQYVFTEGNFIFLETASDIGKTVMQLQGYSFWNSRFENHFIICQAVPSDHFLEDLLDYIWNKNVLNFVLVFVEKHFEVFSYKPFTQENVMNFFNYLQSDGNLFPDKLMNLNGYNLRVLMFDLPPSAVKFKNEWYGPDYQQLKMVMSMMNATFSIIEHKQNGTEHFEEAFRSIRAHETDFCFVSHFQEVQYYKSVEYTYPHRTNALVLLMPITQDIRKKRNLLSIFSLTIWILFIILIATTFASIKLANRQQVLGKSSWVSFLHIWSAFLGYPITNMWKKKPLVQYQLLLFIMMCLVFRTAFHCFLISS